MFGDMMNMMGKLKETQKKVEDTKKRLDTVLIDEKSTDERLKITLTANRTIKSITIAEDLLKNKEEGWELSEDEILDLVRKYDGKPVTEVHIVGGVHPKMGLMYFANLIKKIKARPSNYLMVKTSMGGTPFFYIVVAITIPRKYLLFTKG